MRSTRRSVMAPRPTELKKGAGNPPPFSPVICFASVTTGRASTTRSRRRQRCFSLTAAADDTGVEGASKSFDLGSFADADTGPWGVSVNWGDGSANTTFFVNAAGALGTRSHTYAEEGSYSPSVTVTDFTSLVDSKSFN